MASDRVVVVGAGIGGLVAALELAAAGAPVTLLERAAAPGGKMREVLLDGRALDAGPTVFTMRWVFDELFAALGERLDAHLDLQPCDVLARHAWGDGSRLDLHADLARSAAAIGDFAGAQAVRGFLAFSRRAGEVYRTLEQPFLRGTKPTPLSLMARTGWRRWPALARISPFATMWSGLGRYFADPRLRQLFGRYATYCGASPFLAPATLMLVAHVEQDGVWLVPGGMHRLVRCLAGLAVARGVRLRYGAHVDALCVDGGRVGGVRLAGGEVVEAGAVVFNGDVQALRGGQLGAPARQALPPARRAQRSLSAWTWALLAECDGFELHRHNVFFADDSAAEFDALFRQRRMPRQPTVYVCAQDRPAASAPSSGGQRLLCLINAPADGDQRRPDAEEIEACRQRTFAQLARCGLQLRPTASRLTTPADFEALFPASGGALYGQASHGWAASFSRPGTRTRLPGLYLAGGSTHPGPGVPMAALSGRLAAAQLLAELRAASTRRFHPVVMPGGTSTR